MIEENIMKVGKNYDWIFRRYASYFCRVLGIPNKDKSVWIGISYKNSPYVWRAVFIFYK